MPPFPSQLTRLLLIIGVLLACLSATKSNAQMTLTLNGAPQAVILTRPNPPGYVQLAAQEVQEHLQRMSGATLPIDVVGTEVNYPGKKFVYVGTSTATTAAGISITGLTLEFYIIRTLNGNLYIVGRDGGDDVWYDLSDCRPGTLFGVYHLLGELLKRQHSDGGWGWVSKEPSDALGTGFALYALAHTGLPSTHEAVRRAFDFLKSTQRPDGSWDVPSTRANDKNQVKPTSIYWGTGWAVVGLLEWTATP